MKIRFATSKFTQKCVVCSSQTSSYDIYEDSGISIRVPICGREENSECRNKVKIKHFTKNMLRELKSELGVATSCQQKSMH